MNSPLFTVPADLTLVLDSGVTLDGNKKNARLVRVDGGTLVMKAGVTVRGSADGGVAVYGGSFTMNGGTISGNMASNNGGGVYVGVATFTMEVGTISGNTASDSGAGGGVCGTLTEPS